MAVEEYCTIADVYALGLPAQAFSAAARPLDGVDPTSGIITLYGHGLSADSPVRFAVESSSIAGATPAALPGGLVVGVTYYAQPVDDSADTFRVSASAGGATINSFSSEPVGLWSLVVDPRPRLLASIRDRSSYVAARSIAYKTPFVQVDGAYPPVLVGLVARMTARDCMTITGAQNPLYAGSAKLVMDRAGEDAALLIDASNGKLVFGPIVDSTPTIVEGGAVSWSTATDGGGSPDWLNVAGGGLLS